MEGRQALLRTQTVCLLILTAIAIGATLFWLSPVLVPFVLAVFFMYCLAPPIEWLSKKLNVPRPIAVTLIGALGCLLLVVLWLIVWSSARQMALNADMYRDQLASLADTVINYLPLEDWGMNPEEVVSSALTIHEDSAGALIRGIANAILSLLSSGALVMIFLFFLLLGQSSQQQPSGMLAEIGESVQNYINLKVIISLVTGGVQGLVLYILGVDFAAVFGLLGFLFNFIPNFGPILAVAAPVPVILLDPELSLAVQILAIALPGVVHFVSGNIVEPKIMGESLDLHPIVVLIALIFFGMVWGIVGMFLATPITGAIRVLLSKMEPTKPIADMMAGRLDALSALDDP